MRSRRAALLAPVVLALCPLAGCSTATTGGGAPATAATSAATTAQPPPAGKPARLSPTDWTTYHRDAARTGVAPNRPAAGPLSIAWQRRLDGAVYGQPLVIGGLVIAATEGDTVYGLDRATGQIRWHVHLGTPVPLSALPCGDIDPLGITGTTVYDRATRMVYAVAETTGFHHVLAGIAVPTGKLVFRRDIPTPDGHPRYDQQRAALLVNRGRVYVAFGGLDGDCGPYQGSINGVPASGRGPIVSYKVPTAREAGMWAAAARWPARTARSTSARATGPRPRLPTTAATRSPHSPRPYGAPASSPHPPGPRTTPPTPTSAPHRPACWATG